MRGEADTVPHSPWCDLGIFSLSAETGSPDGRMTVLAHRRSFRGTAVIRSLLGKVEMWRGGCRSHISVSASFVWRCLSGATVAPFPHPAHRTGHADLPHPALGQDLTPLLSRATPSAAFEHQSELIGCPISKFFAT